MEPSLYLPPPCTIVYCKFCGSEDVVKFGTYRGEQRFWCKTCRRKFADNDALPGMRVPPETIGAALSAFYAGASINDIRRHLLQIYELFPSKSTIYRWVVRYSNKATKVMNDFAAVTGDTWVADETVLKIGGKNYWFWDVIDSETRLLLASHLTLRRQTRDAIRLFEKANERVEQGPGEIITDKLRSYISAIEEVYGADVCHVQTRGFREQPNTNLIERFHGTVKERVKVMRGMSSRDTAVLVMNGFLVHYNFLRPHESLGDITPGEVAGIEAPFQNWEEIVEYGC